MLSRKRVNSISGTYDWITLSPKRHSPPKKYFLKNCNEIKIIINEKEDLEFVLADIPGLIKHASDGKGLGHDFLSHVERCKILIHVVDITEEKPFENYKVIRQELLNYGGKIEQKKEIIALNKIEIADQKRVEEIKKEFETLNQEVKLISAATGHQLDQLTNLCLEYLQNE